MTRCKKPVPSIPKFYILILCNSISPCFLAFLRGGIWLVITKFPLKFLRIFICLYLEWMRVWLDSSRRYRPCKSAGWNTLPWLPLNQVCVCEWRKWDFRGSDWANGDAWSLYFFVCVANGSWGEGTIRLVTCATLEINALTGPVVTRDTMEQGCWCIRVRSYARRTWTMWLRQDNWSIFMFQCWHKRCFLQFYMFCSAWHSTSKTWVSAAVLVLQCCLATSCTPVSHGGFQ